jgi:hypothetical protein
LSLEPVVDAPGVEIPVNFPVAEADDEVDVDDKSLTPTDGAIFTKCEPVSLVQVLMPNGPHHQFSSPQDELVSALAQG